MGARPGTLADLVRAHRRRAMVSQEQLARDAGVSARTVSDIERGLQVAPRPGTLRRLATALGLTSIESERLVAAARSGRSARGRDPARAAADARAWQLAVAAYDDDLRPILAEAATTDAACDRLLELGDAATMGLLRHQARPAYLQAARAALRLADRDRLLHAAEGYSFLTKAGDPGDGAERLWHQALLGTPADDLEARAALGAARATALQLDGAHREARAAADLALDLARRSGLPGATAVPAAAACVAGWGDPHPRRRLELGRTVTDCPPTRIPSSGLEGIELEAVPLIQLGHFGEFREIVDRFAAAAPTAASQSVAAQALQWQATLHLLDGHPAAAVEVASQAVHTAGSPPNFTAGFHAQVFCATRTEGQHQELAGAVRALAAASPVEPAWVAALIVCLAQTPAGRGEACELVDRVVAELWPLSEGWTKIVTLAFLAEAAALTGHRPLAEAVEADLASYEGQFVVVATGTSCEGSVSRYLACTAWARGDRARARSRFDDAVDAELAAGAPVLAGATASLVERLAGG